MIDTILEDLNDIQKAAVLYNDGPALIIAGAGSGKTRVLTRKVACLLEQGYQPWTIMALTFTNKAAKEMKERISTLVDSKSAARLWMGTFHSIFLRILRMEASVLGFPPDFTIYDTTDTKNLLKTIVKEMQLDEKIYKPNAVYSHISKAKNDLISPLAYINHPDYQQQDAYAKMPRIGQIYIRYAERCRLAKAMDFDDILFNTNILFRDHPEVLAIYQERLRYILVDEYQDTNFSQHLIVKRLAEKHHKVCVVGDDSQSIYSFRGANIDNILNFKTSYPECRLFKLERNYRSTQNIVNIANSLIDKNREQIKKKVFSERECGSLIKVMSAFSDIEEAYMTASLISELQLRNHDPWNQFAVLYRTNSQSRILEESMRKRNIPYRVYGSMSFYQRKEIKDVIAYLRLITNPDDEEAFKRIINYPARSIGDTTLQKIAHAALTQGVSLWNVLCDPAAYQLPINSGTASKLNSFKELIEKLQQKIQECNVYDFTDFLLMESGINKELNEDISPEGVSRKENVKELLTGMHDFCQSHLEEDNQQISVSDFLSEVSLYTDQDDNQAEAGDKITLMTIHAAKGLEFNNVIVTGLEENIFPSSHSVESDRSLEEERRLLYVAITRAGNNCILTYAKSRFRNGQTEFSRPSRFLSDLDKSLLDLPDTGTISAQSSFGASSSQRSFGASSSQRSFGAFESYDRPISRKETFPTTARPFIQRKPQEAAETKPSLSPSSKPAKWTRISTTAPTKTGWESQNNETLGSINNPSSSNAASTTPMGAGKGIQTSKGNFYVGQRILHERFGEGCIKKIEGQGDNCKIGVEFTHAGEKTLLLKFASMRPLE